MSEDNRIAISAENIGMSTENDKTIVEWRGLNIVVLRHISMQDMVEFVNSVVEMCFSSDDMTYQPEIRDFAEKYYIIEKYTNLDLPEDVSEKYDLIYRTDLVNTVIKNIDTFEQLNAICDAVEEKVANRAQSNIEAITTRVNQLADEIEKVGETLISAFGDVDPEAVEALTKALTDGGLSDESIAKAIVESTQTETDDIAQSNSTQDGE